MVSSKRAAADEAPWWRGAVIYQIYPRSFADTNGDGIGDLPGIARHLDYVASLGVDAIWLSPFFTSPMRDFGYDVADYCDVDPIFGSLADFDALVERAHALGLKVVIDQVWSHTSDQHAWFDESRADRTNLRADWYVWADPKPAGSPPNNWQSVFGGPAWTWDARRQQYYLHNFLPEQPQLNGHHPAVQKALLDTARFWLDRGVDGFRLDAINFLMFDPALPDNPPAPDDGTPRTRPFDYQLHLHNQSDPGIVAFLERVRGLTDAYPARFTVAEVGGLNSDAERKDYTAGTSRLDTSYGFEFLYAPTLTPRIIAEAVASWPDAPGTGWPSWAFDNHDAPRAISRWRSDDPRAFAAMTIALLMALRGNIFLYYGQELGLTQVDIAFDDLRDPEAIANWPRTLSRDGARTPMPWLSDAPNAGFTRSRPWLPVGADHAALAVDRQEIDPGSLLHLTRSLIALRKAYPALRLGRLTNLVFDDSIVSFQRVHGGERLSCAFNLSGSSLAWTPPDGGWRVLHAINDATPDRLPAYGAIILARE